ncbi:hypothetical protein MXD63_45740, partial [Frankia sp. Cpl3]|nr:hypothetical protein [Frankia sp. Cpl3]
IIWFVLIVGLLCFAGGVYATHASAAKTDWEWARQAGYLSANAKPEQEITQAQFLQMVMGEYDAQEKGVIVPPGAENHWAAEY